MINIINEKLIESMINETAKNLANDIINYYHEIQRCNFMIEEAKENSIKSNSMSESHRDAYLKYNKSYGEQIENLKGAIITLEQQMIEKRSFYANELTNFIEMAKNE